VVPIFKKGNAADPQNYRPISITSVPCRILERIIKDALIIYLKTHGLLPKDQFGFLSGRSTTLQLLNCLNDWTEALELGIPVDIITIDFAKAFDSVVHSKLLCKLLGFGVRGNLFAWVSDFLANRQQSVVVGSAVSSTQTVSSGVPQGSVLGPLLFLLFISDLNTDDISVSMPKFADDVKLYRTIIEHLDHLSLQSALYHVYEWSQRNQLPINNKKCLCFHLGRNNNSLEYQLNDKLISENSSIKDLGVWLSSNLKFTAHCNFIVSKAKSRSALIRRCFVSRDTNTLIWAFKVFVRPILEYASPVWSPYLIKDIKHVESVQKSFTKLLPGMYTTPYSERLKILGLKSLELRRLWADLCMTYAILHNLVDIDPTVFFLVRGHNCVTRGHPLKLVGNHFKKDCTKYFFANRVVNPWNSLPSEVVLSGTLASFKRKLKGVDLSRFLSCF